MNLIHRQPNTTVTLQLLACLVMVVLPHTPHLQPWIWLCFAVMVSWRAIAAIKHWNMPSRAIRMALGLLAMVGVYVTHGNITGQTAGVALLIVLIGAKLTELHSFRDHVVVALLAYFVLISQFLFSQELVMVLWLIAGALLITTTLLSISHPQSPLPLKVSIKRASVLLIQAAPLMLIFFVLFPRIPGPLWGLPSADGTARTGLSDSMSPGDIAHLIGTDEIAFRASFEAQVPPAEKMYWRGPVFDFFTGRTWKAKQSGINKTEQQVTAPALQAKGQFVDYQVTLEPHNQHWVFMLDMPVFWSLDKAGMLPDGQINTRDKITDRKLYSARSALEYTFEPTLSNESRQRNLLLPNRGNPQTRDLAERWKQRGLSQTEIITTILKQFREEEYVYTLQPPKLGRDSVDEFLFGTRRGFCEHYASSFTFLMRAAGIPARVVTGYQGSEYNELGNYYIVRQSDAHAWSEVWLENRGWVRIDPTAAVAPERIELGLQAALPLSDSMIAAIARRRGEGLLRTLRMQWDWVNNSWYRWVLGYGPELQSKFLSRFGIEGWGNMILALTLLGSAFLGGLGLVLVWQMSRREKLDPIQKHWQCFSDKFKRLQLQRLSNEGPQDYRQRVIDKLPGQSSEIDQIINLYMRLRYGRETSDQAEHLQTFKRLVKNFKPRPSAP